MPRFDLRRTLSVVAPLLLTACAARSDHAREPILGVVETAARAASAVDAVWPGYRPLERGFIVYESGGRALLVTSARPPAPWTELDADVRALRGRLYALDGGLPGMTGGYRLDYDVGDREYLAVELDETTRETLTTLYHEGFHAWQRSAFARFDAEVVLPEALTPEQTAGAELERRILIAALVTDGAASDSLIATFIAARRARYSALTEAAIRTERSTERKEGTAHLVGVQAAAAALRLDPDSVREAMVRTLQQDLRDFGSEAIGQWRWRAYGAAAMGYVLDRRDVDWRDAVAAGAPFDSILAANLAVEARSGLVAAARERFGYATLLSAAQRDYVAPVADPVAALLASAPYRLVLEVHTAQVGYDFEASIDPGTGGIVSPDESVMVMQAPASISISSPEFELTTAQQPFMLDGRVMISERVMSFSVMLPSISIDGAEPTDRSGPSPAPVVITGQQTRLSVPGDRLVAIDVEPGIVTVRVREP